MKTVVSPHLRGTISCYPEVLISSLLTSFFGIDLCITKYRAYIATSWSFCLKLADYFRQSWPLLNLTPAVIQKKASQEWAEVCGWSCAVVFQGPRRARAWGAERMKHLLSWQPWKCFPGPRWKMPLELFSGIFHIIVANQPELLKLEKSPHGSPYGMIPHSVIHPGGPKFTSAQLSKRGHYALSKPNPNS